DDGTTTGRFKIPDLHAHMLRKALEAFVSPRRLKAEERSDSDGRKLTRPELLGKGLCEFIERYPFAQIGRHAGMNATVVVTIDLDNLLSGLGTATLDTGGVISAGEARRLACEAGLIPMVLDSESMPLDVGRKCRFHTEAQRLAISLRDQTCRAEGCDRLSGFCEFHHVIPWAQGGATSVADGAMLCSWHHHRIHDPRYDHTRSPAGRIQFYRRQ
ncbi:MAG TPA: DUF222 domain-containing protein, partial [Nocardioidaceae bacterium]|nr:DUF222 domain-containing protein [Nocardioidaceae bacterium]HET7387287.1 DUF222 domain-containing protein [Nocardioidaceae bacterium]